MSRRLSVTATYDMFGVLCDAFLGHFGLVRRGLSVLGYFHWTLMDNFEWISAFDSRLGLYEVDRRDGTYDRIAKPSARVYADVARTLNGRM